MAQNRILISCRNAWKVQFPLVSAAALQFPSSRQSEQSWVFASSCCVTKIESKKIVIKRDLIINFNWFNMYTISKAPSKLVATKTRRGKVFHRVGKWFLLIHGNLSFRSPGLPQNFEKIETIRELSKKSASDNNNEFRWGCKRVSASLVSYLIIIHRVIEIKPDIVKYLAFTFTRTSKT